MALVGANGAGKTTLIKLLARLYDPTEGAILVDGRDLREYDLEEWRRQIGVIFQDFVKYDLSAQENIGFGQVEYAGDRERVRKPRSIAGAGRQIRADVHRAGGAISLIILSTLLRRGNSPVGRSGAGRWGEPVGPGGERA